MIPPRIANAETSRSGPPARWTLVLLAIGLAAGFAVARRLEPSPKGMGTHTQLGLPPCLFARTTGHPCPSCGMTTSFAWFARGRLDRSFRANPAGLVLATACLLAIPWLLLGAATGTTPGVRSWERPLAYVLVVTLGVSLVSWTIRLFLGQT